MQSWQEWMEHAAAGDFAELAVQTSCCGSHTTLNDLAYEWPAGSARFVLEAQNPGIGGALPENHITAIEEALGCEVRQILSPY